MCSLQLSLDRGKIPLLKLNDTTTLSRQQIMELYQGKNSRPFCAKSAYSTWMVAGRNGSVEALSFAWYLYTCSISYESLYDLIFQSHQQIMNTSLKPSFAACSKSSHILLRDITLPYFYCRRCSFHKLQSGCNIEIRSG